MLIKILKVFLMHGQIIYSSLVHINKTFFLILCFWLSQATKERRAALYTLPLKKNIFLDFMFLTVPSYKRNTYGTLHATTWINIFYLMFLTVPSYKRKTYGTLHVTPKEKHFSWFYVFDCPKQQKKDARHFARYPLSKTFFFYLMFLNVPSNKRKTHGTLHVTLMLLGHANSCSEKCFSGHLWKRVSLLFYH